MSTIVEEQQPPQADTPAVEQAPPPETEAPKADQTVEQPGATTNDVEKNEKAAPPKEKKQRTPRENKKPKTPSHPPYFQMIKEAITALSEKGGSSPSAIAKYMAENHKAVLPHNFRKILGLQLKNCVSKGKLIKIKASYKLSEAGKKKESGGATTRTKTRAARANAGAKPAKDSAAGAVSKRRKPKSRAVSKIANPPQAVVPSVGPNTRRRSKRAAPAKPKQLKTIKKAKKASAAA